MKLISLILALLSSFTALASSDGMSCSGFSTDGSEIIFDTKTFRLTTDGHERAINLLTLEASYPMEGEICTFGASINDQAVATLTLGKLLREFDIWEEGGEPCDGGLGYGPGAYGSTMVYRASFIRQNVAPVEFELVCKAAANYSADCRIDEWIYESF